jgi:hypothetical protein
VGRRRLNQTSWLRCSLGRSRMEGYVGHRRERSHNRERAVGVSFGQPAARSLCGGCPEADADADADEVGGEIHGCPSPSGRTSGGWPVSPTPPRLDAHPWSFYACTSLYSNLSLLSSIEACTFTSLLDAMTVAKSSFHWPGKAWLHRYSLHAVMCSSGKQTSKIQRVKSKNAAASRQSQSATQT